MALRELVLLPDSRLRLISTPFEKVDAPLRRLADDMLETMYDAPGIGLAGVQIGEMKRIFVLDMARKEEPLNPMVFINPVITKASNILVPYEEGCLSIPDYFAEVTRPDSVSVQYLDLDGNQKEMLCEGLLATCVQHELDHLNGILFIDYLSRLKKSRVMTKFTKLAKEKIT